MIIFKPHKVFTHLSTLLPANSVIIEAGAFDGTDTIKLAKTFPQGTIHAFEPVPELFMHLKTNTAPYHNIHCYQYALSNTNAIVPFYISEKPDKPGKPSQAGSLLPPKDRLVWSPIIFPRTIEVSAITLPAWMAQHTITHIDCLWLDMQGNEFNVLQAAQPLLPMISVIYTEVGFVEGYERQPTYDVIQKWLIEQQFIPYGRTFTNTHDWFFGNILFKKLN